jgi:hypothetical protein
MIPTPGDNKAGFEPLNFGSLVNCSTNCAPASGLRPYKNMAVSISEGNNKGGSITVPLTSCLTGLD